VRNPVSQQANQRFAIHAISVLYNFILNYLQFCSIICNKLSSLYFYFFHDRKQEEEYCLEEIIKVQNLTKRYGPTVAVDNVSFSAYKGEILGFLGPNGAGKTTTMRVLTCYLGADEGTATVNGYDIFEDSLEVRKNIGYLPEDTPLYTDMGVVDYLDFIAQVRNIPKDKRQPRIKEMVDVCGLEKVVQKDVGELSKGYRQRVGLAQALIHDPDILILDEPTSGLDPNQIVEVRSLIKEIGREKTIILSTHILPEVSATCSRILIINEGKIVADGTAEQLAGRAQGEEVIYAGIRGDVEQIEEKLELLPVVVNFNRKGNGDSEIHGYEIIAQRDSNASEEIFRMVASNGWSLNELRQETISLEDVFQRLTTEI